MLKLYNTVMGTYMNMPDHYAGVFPFVEAPEEVPPIQENLEGYKVAPVDADNDGYIQDGTDFERPEGTEIDEREAMAIQSEADRVADEEAAQAKAGAKASGVAKLAELGLTAEEISAITGA